MSLRVENLSLERGTRILQRALNFEVQPGEALWVRGPNGVGKSTLLETICKFRTSAQGDVYWQGANIKNGLDRFHEAIAYIGHKNGNNENLTAQSSLEFYAKLYQSDRAQSALEETKLGHRREVEVRYLSAGQQKRLALARLLLRDAPLWILDEPSVSLDQDGVDWLTRLICAHLEKGGAILFTSHVELDVPAQSLVLEGMKKSEERKESVFLSDEWEGVL